MKIEVPPNARQQFWQKSPDGSPKFWLFRSRPACEIGEQLIFLFDGRPGGQAFVSGIEPPGVNGGYSPEEFDGHWKVYWHQKSFQVIESRYEPRKEKRTAAKLPRIVAVTELREFVFCPRSWKLRRQDVKAPSEALRRKEERTEEGNRYHLKHAQAVCRAEHQTSHPRVYKGYLAAVGWVLIILGVFVCLFSWRF